MASEALTKSEFRFGETSISCFHRKSAADCQRCWTMQDDEPQCSGELLLRGMISIRHFLHRAVVMKAAFKQEPLLAHAYVRPYIKAR